jgi:DNA polymerase-3 subunit gamma/tau
VLGIVEALAACSGEAVVAQADALRAAGLSAAGTLEDLATLLQQMAIALAAPAALDEADPETADVRRLATLLPHDEIQLMYSMALHGRQELGLAPDEYAGLLMVLLRMLSFRPAGATPKVAAPRPATAQPLVRPAAVAKAIVPVPLPSLLKPEPAPVLAPVPATVAAPAPVAVAGAPAAPRLSDRLRPKPVEAAPEDGPPDDTPPPWLEVDDGGALSVAEARPEPARAAAPELVETPIGTAWAERVEGLGLTALVRELAWQAQPLARDDAAGRETWTLRVERESLRAPALVAKLEAALEAGLVIEPGVASDSVALRAVARAQAQQRQAEQIAAGHPLTQALLTQFKTARILPGSVQPITS